jgi:hypothetical protein
LAGLFKLVLNKLSNEPDYPLLLLFAVKRLKLLDKVTINTLIEIAKIVPIGQKLQFL